MRLVLAALVALLALPAAARAQDVDAAAKALSKDYVYVDPRAEAAPEIDAGALDRTIRDADAGPVFVAVLPAAAAEGRTVDETLQALHDKAGISGTYVLVLGREFRAGSDELPVADLATAATRDHPGDIEAILTDFVGRVADVRTDDDGIPTKVILIILGPFILAATAVIFAVVFVVRKGLRRRAAELAGVKRNVRDDLVALGDDIRALELDVQMAGRDSEAAKAYASAVEAYERANRRYEAAGNVRDLRPVAESLEEGRYAMTWAREVLAGRTAPQRRAPCFFDPRHGPSARDVEWAPDHGTPRSVPACEADAQRVERGEEPRARTIDGVPYWEAGPAYAPFYAAFFPGLLIGSMTAGGWDSPTPTDYGGFSGGGGGDFGGGGGGDFGGGGGDFGGGSF